MPIGIPIEQARERQLALLYSGLLDLPNDPLTRQLIDQFLRHPRWDAPSHWGEISVN